MNLVILVSWILFLLENKEVYEGEVTEISPVETENPAGGFTKTVSHVVLGLKSAKGMVFFVRGKRQQQQEKLSILLIFSQIKLSCILKRSTIKCKKETHLVFKYLLNYDWPNKYLQVTSLTPKLK